MPTIKITTCKQTPNFCALEAVAKLMMDNYRARTYKKERVVTVKSGRELKVKELARKKGMSVCSCNFNVTNTKIKKQDTTCP